MARDGDMKSASRPKQFVYGPYLLPVNLRIVLSEDFHLPIIPYSHENI